MLIAPGRCSSAYSASGSTSMSCAPCSSRCWTRSRSIGVAISDLGCFPFERVAYPALLRLTGKAARGAVDAAGEHVLVALGGLRINVAAGDANRRRAEEAQPPRRFLVWHVHE